MLWFYHAEIKLLLIHMKLNSVLLNGFLGAGYIWQIYLIKSNLIWNSLKFFDIAAIETLPIFSHMVYFLGLAAF